MTQTTVEREALADYAILLAEGAVVLSALATARTPAARAEDLADLRAVHAEGENFPHATPTSNILRGIFDCLEHAGEDLALQTETQPDTLQRVLGVQRLAQDLAFALDEAGEGHGLDRLNQDLRTLDPTVGPALDLEAAVALAKEVTARSL